jgi:hydroxymethylglutaryl-CoA lyase
MHEQTNSQDTGSSLAGGMLELVEVGPRDGLQNESVVLTLAQKRELVMRTIDAGVRRVEVSSFVNPRLVPQLADAAELFASLGLIEGVELSALVLNVRGVERAIAAGVKAIDVVVLATDTFSQRNQGTDVAGMLERYRVIHAAAKQAGQRVTLTVSAAFGCPFEGTVAPANVSEILASVADARPDELALADTIGVGVPSQVRELFALAAIRLPGVPLRAHFHNTRNTGYANALAAAESGVTALDAALGGIGGCPFAPAATGNVASEDLAYLLAREGWQTGADVGAYLDASTWLASAMGRELPGLVARAGSALL